MFSYYTTVTLMLVLIWILIFITKSELRREMIILGILALFMLPLTFTIQAGDDQQIQQLFSSLSFFNLIFAFCISGIAGVIFHAFFGKHYHLMPHVSGSKKENGLANWWILRLFFAILFLIWITLFISIGFDIRPASAVLIAAIIIAVYMVSHRQDLLIDSAVSGVLTALVVYVVVSLAGIFSLTQIDISFIDSTNYFAGVPTELIIWSLSLGIVLGPLYEYIRRIELK